MSNESTSVVKPARSRGRAAVVGLAAVGALAGGLGMAPSAFAEEQRSETSTSDEMRTQGSKGFRVINATDKTMNIKGWYAAGKPQGEDWEGRPNLGDTIGTGDAHIWELKFKPFMNNYAALEYQYYDAGWKSFNVYIGTSGVNKPTGVHCDTDASIKCEIKGENIVITQPGKHIIPAAAQETQARLMEQLCGEQQLAEFKFKPTKEEKGYERKKPDYPNLINDTPGTDSYERTYKYEEGQSTSIGVRLSVSTGFAVNQSIETTFKTTTSKSESYTKTLTLNVPEGYMGWIEVGVPVWKHTGDFEIKMGDATYILQDVTITSPIGEGDKDFPMEWYFETEKLSK